MLLNWLSSACIVQAAHASSLYVNAAISLVVAQWKSTRLGSKTPEVVGSMPVVYWSFVFFFHLPLSNRTVQCSISGPSRSCISTYTEVKKVHLAVLLGVKKVNEHRLQLIKTSSSFSSGFVPAASGTNRQF